MSSAPIPATCPVTLVADVRAVLGEGPLWVVAEQALYWVDIKGRKIFRLGPEGAFDEWQTPFRIGAIAPAQSGGFIAATEHGIARIDLAADRFELLFDPEEDRPTNRFNDGKVDGHGQFFAGTMDDREVAASGAFYRIDKRLGCTRFDDGFRVTNGPAFSPDGRYAYVNDSALQLTYAYTIGTDLMPAGRREFIRWGEGEGYPDGMTVDAQGCLWISFWDGGCLRRVSPDGERIDEWPLPVSRPTSCAFGGPELDRLFVTSARIGLDEQQLVSEPAAGGLFMLQPGVSGIAGRPFAG